MPEQRVTGFRKGFLLAAQENKCNVNGGDVKGVLILAFGIANTKEKKKKGQRHKRGREERRKTKKLNICSDMAAIWVTALLPGNGCTLFCVN